MTVPTTDTGIPRGRECEAFLEALDATPASAVSACEGWTAHEVTAHVTAAAAEVSRHLDPYLQGDPVPVTLGFEEREAPYRAMAPERLRRRLEAERRGCAGSSAGCSNGNPAR